MTFSHLIGLASGHAEARILQTAVSLGIFEALASAPSRSPGNRQQTSTRTQGDRTALNALAALNILKKRAQQFSLSEAAERYLLRSSPQYLGGMIMFEDLSWQSWAQLPEAIRTGRPARPANMYQEDPSETEIFINAMDSLVKARGDTEAVITALDWQDVGVLLDVGSGPASYPIALCRKFSNMRAAIFDLPGTLRITERYVREAGMTDRITLIAGDIEKIRSPEHLRRIFLSNIIHVTISKRNQNLINSLHGIAAPRSALLLRPHPRRELRQSAVGAIFAC